METLKTQLDHFKNGNLTHLSNCIFASGDVKDYDFINSTSAVFGFIMKIKNSKYINEETDIIGYRVRKQELLGYPSILIHIMDADTEEIKFSIELDVMHRNKSRFKFVHETPFQELEFDSFDSLLGYINKED